jgi:hypothetical protein
MSEKNRSLARKANSATLPYFFQKKIGVFFLKKTGQNAQEKKKTDRDPETKVSTWRLCRVHIICNFFF